jgi:PKHD-type hydroxylase
MNLFNYYWWYSKALSNETCDSIIELGNSKNNKSQLGVIGNTRKDVDKKPLDEKEKKDLFKRRNSNITWLDEKWLYELLQPFIYDANEKANWNFKWDYTEEIQFTKYEINQHYSWHCDSSPKPYNKPNTGYHNKIRKLSAIISLSNPKDYLGGKVEFQFRNSIDSSKINECKEISERGSIVVFPSFVWHRVTPITKGTRYSLVMWNLGYPFQ